MLKRTTAVIQNLSQKRQNHARRRFVASSSVSCALSTPKRLGQGMIRRSSTSARPRKTTQTQSVRKSDQPVGQPWCRWNQKKTAGELRTATMVAMRENPRQAIASEVFASIPRVATLAGLSAIVAEV